MWIQASRQPNLSEVLLWQDSAVALLELLPRVTEHCQQCSRGTQYTAHRHCLLLVTCSFVAVQLQAATASSLQGLLSPVVHEEECMVAALCRA